jgi:hypothetical protein
MKIGCLAAAVDSVERDLPVGADRVPGEGTPAAQDRVKKEDNSDQVPDTVKKRLAVFPSQNSLWAGKIKLFPPRGS